MKRAMGEMERRRVKQLAHNKAHGITPKGIKKAVADVLHAGYEELSAQSELDGISRQLERAYPDLRQVRGEELDPRTRHEPDLTLVRQRRFDPARRGEELARRGALRPGKFLIDAAFHDAVRSPGKRVHRHGIGDFVRQHDAAETLRQALDPLRARSEPRLLPRAQAGAGLENQVVLRRQFPDQCLGERAASGAELEDRFAGLQEFRHLARQRGREQGAHFRGGGEIPRDTELGRTARVVAQLRRVERQFHVARKADPVVPGLQLGADALEQQRACGERIGLGFGQHAANLT